MVDWNITIENFIGKRRIKIEKMNMKIFNFFFKTATDCKF